PSSWSPWRSSACSCSAGGWPSGWADGSAGPGDRDGGLADGGLGALQAHGDPSRPRRSATGRGPWAVGRGPWALVEADLVRGRTLTSWPSLKTDIRNAGGNWMDTEIQVWTNGPNTLVTSRKPDDLPAFSE
ncbi:MAG: DJ-1/PfpI family protein, partial [Actinomycetes bacterium]